MTTKPDRNDYQDDAEFDKAMALWLADPANQTNNGQVKPQQSEVRGVITSVTRELMKETNGEKRFFRLIKVGDSEEILVSKTLFDSNAQLLQVGNAVVVTADKRIANKTGYADQSGAWKLHAGNGLSFVKGSYDTATAERKGAVAEKNSARQQMFAGATSQIADTISKADGADKQAIAMAFAGVVKFEI